MEMSSRAILSIAYRLVRFEAEYLQVTRGRIDQRGVDGTDIGSTTLWCGHESYSRRWVVVVLSRCLCICRGEMDDGRDVGGR